MCRQYVHVRVHTTHSYDTVHNLGAFCAGVAGLAVDCICALLPLWQKLIDVLFCCNRRKYLFGTQAFSLNRPSPPHHPLGFRAASRVAPIITCILRIRSVFVRAPHQYYVHTQHRCTIGIDNVIFWVRINLCARPNE